MFGNLFADADVGMGGFQTTASGGAGAELGFGPTTSGMTGRHPLYPDDGVSTAFWLGAAGLVALILLRRSLPA